MSNLKTKSTTAWIEIGTTWNYLEDLKSKVEKVETTIDKSQKSSKIAKRRQMQLNHGSWKKSSPVRKTTAGLHNGSAVNLTALSSTEKESHFRRAKKRKVIRCNPSFEQVLPVTEKPTNSGNTCISELDLIPTKLSSANPVKSNVSSENVAVINDLHGLLRPTHVFPVAARTLNDEEALASLVQNNSTPFFTSRLQSAMMNDGMQSLQLLIENQKKLAKESEQSPPREISKLQRRNSVRQPLEELSVHSQPLEELYVDRQPLEELSVQDEQLKPFTSRKIIQAQLPLEYKGFARKGDAAVWQTPNKLNKHQGIKRPLAAASRPLQKKVTKIKKLNDSIISTSTWREGRKLILKKLKNENANIKPKVSHSSGNEHSSSQKIVSGQKVDKTAEEKRMEQEDIDRKLKELFAVKRRKKVAKLHTEIQKVPPKRYDVDVVRGFIKRKREERKKILREEEDHRSNLVLQKKQSLRSLDEFCKRKIVTTHPTDSLRNNYETSKQLWGEKYVHPKFDEQELHDVEMEIASATDVPVPVRESVEVVEMPVASEPQQGSKEVDSSHKDDDSNASSKSKDHIQRLKIVAREIEANIEMETSHIEKVVSQVTEDEEDSFPKELIASRVANKEIQVTKGADTVEKFEQKIDSSAYSDEADELNESYNSLRRKQTAQSKHLTEASSMNAYDPYNFISALSRKQLSTGMFSHEVPPHLENSAIEDDGRNRKGLDFILELLQGSRTQPSQTVNDHLSAWLRDIQHTDDINATGLSHEGEPSVNDELQASTSQNIVSPQRESFHGSHRSGHVEQPSVVSISSSTGRHKKKNGSRKSVSSRASKLSDKEVSNSTALSVGTVSEEIDESVNSSGTSITTDKQLQKILLHSELISARGPTDTEISLDTSTGTGTIKTESKVSGLSSIRTRSSIEESLHSGEVELDSSVRTASSLSRPSSRSSNKSRSLKTISTGASGKTTGSRDSNSSTPSVQYSQETSSRSTLSKSQVSHSVDSMSSSEKVSSEVSKSTSSSSSRSNKKKFRAEKKTSSRSHKPAEAQASLFSRQIHNEISCLDFLSDQLLCVSELNMSHAAQMAVISHHRTYENAIHEENCRQLREYRRLQEDSYRRMLDSIRDKHQQVLDKAVVDAQTSISHATASILENKPGTSNDVPYSSDFETTSAAQSPSIEEEILSSGSTVSASTLTELCSANGSTVSEKLALKSRSSATSSDITEKLKYHLDAAELEHLTDTEGEDNQENTIESNLTEGKKSYSSSKASNEKGGLPSDKTGSFGPENSVKVGEKILTDKKQRILEEWKSKVAREKAKIAGLNLIKRKLEQQGDEKRAKLILKTEKRIVKKLKENRQTDKLKGIDTSHSVKAETISEVSSHIEEQFSSIQESVQEAAITASTASNIEECISSNIEERFSSVVDSSNIEERLSSVVDSSNTLPITEDISSQVPSSSHKVSASTSKTISSSKLSRSKRGSLSLRLRSHPFMHDSSVSDESVTISHSETASEYTDLEVRVYALKEELRQRKSVAERLKSELKKKHRETLKKKEESLKKQIEAYDQFIQQTTEELNREIEASASQTISVVKPKIRQPQRFEHRQDGTTCSSSSLLSHSQDIQHSKYEDTFTGSRTVDKSEAELSFQFPEKILSTSQPDATGRSISASEAIVDEANTSVHSSTSQAFSVASEEPTHSTKSEEILSVTPANSDVSLSANDSINTTSEKSLEKGVNEGTISTHSNESINKSEESIHSEEKDDVTMRAETVLSTCIKESDVHNSPVPSLGESTSIESFSSSVTESAIQPTSPISSNQKKEVIASQVAEVIYESELTFTLDLIKRVTSENQKNVQTVESSSSRQEENNRKEVIVEDMVQKFIGGLVNSSISCIMDVHNRKQNKSDVVKDKDDVIKKVTSIMSCLNGKKNSQKCRPQDLMMISSVESEAEWFAEKSDDNNVQVPDALLIEEPEWFDDDIGLGVAATQQQQQQQQQQQYPPYYYRKIPDKPPPPYSPAKATEAEKAPEPVWSVPRETQEVRDYVSAAATELFDAYRLASSLKNAIPTPEYISSNANLSEVEAGSQRAFRHFLFDLAKETALEMFSDRETQSDPWVKPKRLTKKPQLPINSVQFVSAVQGKMEQNLSYLMGHTPATSGSKFGIRQRERVGLIMLEEMQKEEQNWVNYNDDEVTVKFQVAEDIFNFLLDDVLRTTPKTRRVKPD